MIAELLHKVAGMSGTTIAAAKRFGRVGVGIELNRAYIDLSVKRLAQGVLPLH